MAWQTRNTPVELCFARCYKSDIETLSGLLDADGVRYCVVKSKHTTHEQLGDSYDIELPYDVQHVKRTTDRILIVRGEDMDEVSMIMDDYNVQGLTWTEIKYGINSRAMGGVWCYRTRGGELKVRIRRKKFSVDPESLERID